MLVHVEALGLVFHLDLERKKPDSTDPEAPMDTQYPMTVYADKPAGFAAPDHMEDR